jgi:hypothetical protein
MRTVLIILLVVIWTAHVFGQIGNQSEAKDIRYEVAKLNSLNQNQGNKYLEEKDIAGSAYLSKQFQPSYVSKINGAEIKDMPLRYNIYNDQMELKKDGKVMSIALPNEVERINMGGKVFIYKPYMTARNVRAGYFQVLYEGDYQLLKREQVKLRSPSEKTNQDDSLRFERTPPQFYLRYSNGMAHLVNSQKTLIKILQPIPQKLIDYIKSNKINTRDEKQLVDLMEYMDQVEN